MSVNDRAFGSSMPTANTSLYNPIVEEQERILSQFQFGGAISSGGEQKPS